ncbi:MAG: DUF4019 domain-containing protein [Phycisphaerae bacterium]|nr:DUF4019 domain-containing protein [Phycisphaerae bacterium]
MKHRTDFTGLVAALLVLGISSVVLGASAEALLKKGIAAEQDKEGIDSALKLYKQIVDEVEADRPHVAEAYLRLGLCHLKKGNKEDARKAFEKVVSRFADQTSPADKAREQLAKLAPAGGVPVVVSTTPACFAGDVPATLEKLTVTFNRKMLDKHWSWVQRYKDKFPKTTGKPSFDAAQKTCSLPVKLEPGKVYWIEFNSPRYTAFRSVGGVIARRHALVFATKGADGKVTKIPDDLAALAKKINARAAGESPEAVKAAIAVAGKWLALVDEGKYAESWRISAAYVRQAVTREKWQASMKAARAPLGKLKSRKLLATHYRTSLPGAPDGQYVVIKYKTSFEKKAEAVETVTPMKEKDGGWRVSGYYIK